MEVSLLKDKFESLESLKVSYLAPGHEQGSGYRF